MTAHDPMLDDLHRMFQHFAGPPAPVRRGAPRPRMKLGRVAILLLVAALLAGSSVAAARQLDLFDGTPASDAVKRDIATSSLGAPPALDPGIDASRAVAMIRLEVPKGTVTLYVSPAKNSSYTYCTGIALSWLGDRPGLGCMGPVKGALPPIDVGIMFPGRAGTSDGYVWGRINDARASSVRFAVADGSVRTVALTHGYFVADLAPGESPTRIDALDTSGAVVATQAMSERVIGIPSP